AAAGGAQSVFQSSERRRKASGSVSKSSAEPSRRVFRYRFVHSGIPEKGGGGGSSDFRERDLWIRSVFHNRTGGRSAGLSLQAAFDRRAHSGRDFPSGSAGSYFDSPAWRRIVARRATGRRGIVQP